MSEESAFPMNYKTYLINLDSSTSRLAKADQQLKEFNIDYQRISAVDGRQLDVHNYADYDSKQANALMGRDLLGAEIGCYLSHLLCIESFLASDAEYAIVLEDDLKLNHDITVLLNETFLWLKNANIEWYLINIGSNKKKLSRYLRQFQEYHLLKSYYFPVLTLGLVWSRQGALNFLNERHKIAAPIDVTLQTWLTGNAKGLSFYPRLVETSGAESDIDARSKNVSSTRNRLRIGKRWPRQKRMWTNKLIAVKNKLANQ